MPLPEFLTTLLQSPRFWKDFFWMTEGEPHSFRSDPPYPQLAKFKLGLPICDGYGLSLSFDHNLITFSLDFIAPNEDPVNIAFDDQAHWHPHVLRWSELETICRAIALHDSELSHPGWVVLLLYRFAPICVNDDIEAITATLEAAWRRIGGLSDNDITTFIERMDARDADFRWREDESVGWVIEQDDDSRAWKGLYTLRSADNEKFPFTEWSQMIEAARATMARLTHVDREAAERFAAGSSADEIPGLVKALRAAGHDVPASSLESSSSKAQACWICEAILDKPCGTITRRELSHECLPRQQHHLKLCIPFNDKLRSLPPQNGKFFTDTLDVILQAICQGGASVSGGSGRIDEKGKHVEIDANYSVHLTGSLDQGIELIRNLLWWSAAPTSTSLSRTGGDEIPLHLETDTTRPGRVVLELAKPGVLRWKSGWRIDREVLPLSCQRAIRDVMNSFDAEAPDDDGWFSVRTPDHRSIDLCAKNLGTSDTLLSITVAIDDLTPSTSSLLFKLMDAGELLLLPLTVATSSSAVKSLSGDWPRVEILDSESRLHQILSAGAFQWWNRR